jgi:hypothetical protein
MKPAQARPAVAVQELTADGVVAYTAAINRMPDPAVARSRFLQLLQLIDAEKDLELDDEAVIALQTTRERLRL